MKRLLLRIAVALLTFSVGYSLFLAAEIYNLKVEIREDEKRVGAEAELIYVEECFLAGRSYSEEHIWDCLKKLGEKKFNANAFNITRCQNEPERVRPLR